MQVEDIARVAPGRIMVSVRLESDQLSGNLVRPDSMRGYLPLAQIIQVGEEAPSWLTAGDWYYISQYAGQIISLEGVGGSSNEARLICTAQDLLCRFRDDAAPIIERMVAA